MAKLVLLAFTIATLLALGSAHRTIVTTTIEEDDISQSQHFCSQHLQGQQLRQCQNYLQQSEQTPYGQQHPQQQQTLQQCCNELRNVNEPCVCQAVKKMFGNVQQQQQQYQQEAGRFGSQQIQQLKQKAQNLPRMCNIQTREQQCNIKTGQQCRQEIQGRRQFNRCQRYLEQQTGSGYLMSAVSMQRQPDEMEQCCEELRNVDMECQCEAMKEVYGQTQEEKRPEEMEELRRMVQNLKNQCNLEVEQCHIPARMF